jgi:predicted O-methyltransferase YrrM
VLVGALVALIAFVGWRLLRPANTEPVRAADGFDPAEFVKARPRLDVPYVATDNEVVEVMLGMAQVRPNEKVVDLGSGDGRILIAAARSLGARGLGVDIDPARVREANANARAAGVAHRVIFRREDLFETPIRDADVVTLYLLQEINIRLRPRLLAELRPGTRVVSHDFDMGDWPHDGRRQVGSASVYLWIVPARVSGRWTMNLDGRRAELEIDQRYQQFTGRLNVDGQAARIEQGRINGPNLRFVARIGGGARRVFEGRLDGEALAGARWRATRAPVEEADPTSNTAQ